MATLVATASLNVDLLGQSLVDYATVHDAASSNPPDTTWTSYVGQSLYAGPTWDIERSGFFFDTSALGAGATISAAVLGLYGSQVHLHATFDITVVSGVDIEDTPVAADYGDLLNDTTSMGTISSADVVTDNFNPITLNATGIAAISKTGITKFAIRSSRDISATEPTDAEWVEFWGTSEAGKEPKLTITYTVSGFPHSQAIFIG